jgi:hypothetical protein
MQEEIRCRIRIVVASQGGMAVVDKTGRDEDDRDPAELEEGLAVQQQLQTMRRALPPGEAGQQDGSGEAPGSFRGMPNQDPRDGGSTGQYL